MELVLTHMEGGGPEASSFEVVERKGIGHPDTICDALAEAASTALCRFYLERFGRVLHHNVDKVLLVGGAARPAFGGGEVTEPIHVHLAGRVTTEVGGERLPAKEIVLDACRSWLAAHLPDLDVERHVRLHAHLRPGSVELVSLFARPGVPRANDSSIGVGSAPSTRLERAVLAVERQLNGVGGPRTGGPDVKVLGVRVKDRVELTVAIAGIGARLPDRAAYHAMRRETWLLARELTTQITGMETHADVNAADDPDRDMYYLTVTGTSAEAGDDGEAGRGNRANGIITPFRPMTMESVAGKNPVNHTGKLYNLAAGRIAADVAALDGVVACDCVLVSRIGSPVNEPAAVQLRVQGRHDRPLLEAAVARHLAALPKLEIELARHGLEL